MLDLITLLLDWLIEPKIGVGGLIGVAIMKLWNAWKTSSMKRSIEELKGEVEEMKEEQKKGYGALEDKLDMILNGRVAEGTDELNKNTDD